MQGFVDFWGEIRLCLNFEYVKVAEDSKIDQVNLWCLLQAKDSVFCVSLIEMSL